MGAGAWRWPHTQSSAKVKERVELYVYSPLWAFVACSRVDFTLLLLLLLLLATLREKFSLLHHCLMLIRTFFIFRISYALVQVFFFFLYIANKRNMKFVQTKAMQCTVHLNEWMNK